MYIVVLMLHYSMVRKGHAKPKPYKSLTLCSGTEILWIQIIGGQNGKHHNQIWDQ
jgi:hypothetical protein